MWTDGRYFLQAEEQLDSNWILMKEGKDPVGQMLSWSLIVGCVFWVYFIGRRVGGGVPFQECVACLYCPPMKIFSNEEMCISKETCKENIYWGENNNIYQDFALLSLAKVYFPTLINIQVSKISSNFYRNLHKKFVSPDA